jgi:predicted dehydrogenase
MQFTRRSFIAHSSKAVAAAQTTLLWSAAYGQSPPSERVVLAVIGLGGRGSALTRGFAIRKDVEFKYLCDLDPRRGKDVLEDVQTTQQRRPIHVKDYQEVFDDPEVDAVVVATPDHWQGPAAIYACQAGKDVYVEKPPSHNIWEGRKMVEAARKYNRIVQAGTQNRSAEYVQEAVQLVRDGYLGDVHLCRVCNLKSGGPFHASPDQPTPEGVDYDRWLGPAPKRPFNPSHFHGTWHMYWDYSGGDLADDGVHQLDIARWLVGRDYPSAIHSSGGNLAFQDDREVPDTQITTFEFPGLIMTCELTQYLPYMAKTVGRIRFGDEFPAWMQNATRIELYGTKRMMVLGRHGGGWQIFTNDGEVSKQRFGRFADPEHKEDFVQSVKTRKRPNADIEEGHRSAVLVHAANISYRLGARKLAFDGATEQFVDDPDANTLVKRNYRPPYTIG